MGETLLEVNELTAGYDQADVIHHVSMQVNQGEISCLLGANGAGKTTLIRTLLGLNAPRAGTVRFGAEDITQTPTHHIARKGITCVPEGRRVFSKMSVMENLRSGAYLETSDKKIQDRIDEVFEFFPRLKERAPQLAGTMSGGEQAMLSIGRGLMSQPKLMIFDEPSLGLSPLFVKENFRIIESINKRGVTVLLVEQNVKQTLGIAHRGYVMSQGQIVASGDVASLREDPAVKAAYFGADNG